MKYKDLPNQNAILRLTAYAFVRDGADESVFKFGKKVNQAYEFFNNQRTKILDKHGVRGDNGEYTIARENQESFQSDTTSLLESEVPFNLGVVDLVEPDFDSSNCRKPSETSLLLSASEKQAILRMADILKEESRIAKLESIKREIETTTEP